MATSTPPGAVVLFSSEHVDSLRRCVAEHVSPRRSIVVLVPVRPLPITLDTAALAQRWEERLHLLEGARAEWAADRSPTLFSWEAMPAATGRRGCARRIARARHAELFISAATHGGITLEQLTHLGVPRRRFPAVALQGRMQ